MEEAEKITASRMSIWSNYHRGFASLEEKEWVRRPIIPPDTCHNSHMYYLLVSGLDTRTALLQHLSEAGFHSVFHYVPLHSSPAGKKYGRCKGDLPVTQSVSDCLLRLPLWPGFEGTAEVVASVEKFFSNWHS